MRDVPAIVRFVSFEPLLEDLGKLNLTGIHWGIIGGETEPKARGMDVAWAKSIVSQCKEQNVAAWVKQLGRMPVVNGEDLILIDSEGNRDFKGDEISLWPRSLKDLNVRRLPRLVV